MLRDKLRASLIEAVKGKQRRRTSTLRLILAAIKDRDIAARTMDKTEEDDDSVILEILGRMIKQRHQSIKAYEEGGRLELAEQEREEITIIKDFLPRQLDDDEIAEVCSTIVGELDAAGLKEMGRVMGTLKSRYAGQMDFSKASAQIKELLTC